MDLNDFFSSLKGKSIEQANKETERICGIVDFFETAEYAVPKKVEQENRAEYGDWQTNFELAYRICLLLKDRGVTPDVIIEPTCGTGTFILASIMVFGKTVRDIYGIEIYKPYLDELKIRLLDYALKNPGTINCRIRLIRQSVFSFNFDSLAIPQEKKVLVVGNPPWVTNSKLSATNSNNLPRKSNFKNIKGIGAITGKANFDIAENITYQLLRCFHNHDTCLAFLIKNSVAKNIVYGQRNGGYNIEHMTQYNIDANKEFGVSVAACLFVAKLGAGRARRCDLTDLYSLTPPSVYGWVDDCFVSNVADYMKYSGIDGQCQLTWWSGLKHDCSRVMELESKDGRFHNNLGEAVDIEPDLIYPLLKSSDLKKPEVASARKYVIVTQKSTSDATDIIKIRQPRTYDYLERHSSWFDQRGSVIYNNRPRYCIFGIGAYSFKEYKIAIAGLCKSTSFSLVKPIAGKCVMLDDTCYLLGFDDEETAACFLKVLNSDIVQSFLKSLVFVDTKRSINKDLLMRIDLEKAAKQLYEAEYISMQEYDLVNSYIQTNHPHQLRLFA